MKSNDLLWNERGPKIKGNKVVAEGFPDFIPTILTDNPEQNQQYRGVVGCGALITNVHLVALRTLRINFQYFCI